MHSANVSGVKRILALAGMGLGFIGGLLTLISYFVLAPQLATVHSSVDAQFSGLDSLLATAERSTANLSSTLSTAPEEALSNMNDALLSYASSSDNLAASLEGAGGVLALIGVDEVGKAALDLRSSGRGMRAASLNLKEVEDSLGSASEDLAGLSTQLSVQRAELARLRSQAGSMLSSLQIVHTLLTLAILAGFAGILLMCGALLFDSY